MPADSDSPGNSYSTLKNRSFRSEGPKGRNSKERCPVLATRSQGRPARPDLLICFIIFRATPLGRVALTCLRPLRARRGQPLLRGRAVCAENWESGFLPEIRGVPSPPFSPLPVPRRRGPRGWGRRHVYPAASHGSGLTHRANRRCPHRRWWSQLRPPLLHARAGPVQWRWLSWPPQPLHSRSAVQAPLRGGELCAARFALQSLAPPGAHRAGRS